MMHARIFNLAVPDRIKHGGVVYVDGGCATSELLWLIVYRQLQEDFMQAESILDIDMRLG